MEICPNTYFILLKKNLAHHPDCNDQLIALIKPSLKVFL